MKKSMLIHPHELSKKWIDKMTMLGVDTLGIHPVGGKDAHDSLVQLLEDVQKPEFRALIDYACDKGLAIAYELHAASFLLPRALFDTHPEYFRMDEDGKRVREYNFCPSNPEAMQIVVSNAVQLAKLLYRSAPQYYFWLDDAKAVGCRCEKCRHLSDSDQQLTILNAILKALQKGDENAKLAYLAYYSTITPPESVKPADGIFAEYAPFERDFKKPLSADNKADTDNIKALLAYFGTKESKVLEYWYDNSLFSKWDPENIQRLCPDNALIRNDIEYYKAFGFEGISTFACYLGADYEKLYGAPDLSGFAEL